MSEIQPINERLHLPDSTSSITTFENITRWIKECTHNHARCNADVDFSPNSFLYLKRVLELTENGITLREDSPSRPTYACLSHCWGSSTNIINTTLKTFEAFKTHISLSELPETSRDLIGICIRLNINFLWIDSLCIIQDGVEDWKSDSANMASIYKNAFLTIAATKPKNSTGGCYRTTHPECLSISVPGTDLFVRKAIPVFPWYPLYLNESNAEEWPLLQRAWVYQEMRLSPRVLHFCSQEVIWQCRCCRKSQSGYNDENIEAENQYDILGDPYWKSAEIPRRLWYRTVQEYSGMKLTYEKDKLPALAALAENSALLRVNDRFLGGLWEKTLLLDLLWHVSKDEKIRRPFLWRGPTWSWASVESLVYWETRASAFHSVKIVDVRYTSKGSAYIGDIEEAKIILRAHRILARIEDGRLALFNPDIQDFGGCGFTWMVESYDYDLSLSRRFHVSSSIGIFIAPIVNCTGAYHHSIILLKIHDSLYERVGYVMLKAWGSALIERFETRERFDNILIKSLHYDFTII